MGDINPSFDLRNPIQRIRDTIGLIIFVFALLVFLSGIGMLILAGHLYGDPISGYPISHNISPSEGESLSVDVTGLTSGNNYDIKIEFKVIPIESDPPTGHIDLQISGEANELQYSFNDHLVNQGFNSTYETSIVQEFPSKLNGDAIVTYEFNVETAVDISFITIEISLYENPNRTIYNLFSTIGIITVFVGVLFMIIGGVVAGKQKKEQSLFSSDTDDNYISDTGDNPIDDNFSDKFKLN